MSSLAAAINLIAAVAPGTGARAVCLILCSNIPPSSQSARPDTDGPRSALTGLAIASVQRATEMQHAVVFDTSQHVWECLCRLRAEGLKLLAEYTALCIQHLAFLAMCLDTADFAAAGLAHSDSAPCAILTLDTLCTMSRSQDAAELKLHQCVACSVTRSVLVQVCIAGATL
jgi:hypothetical protein